MKILLGITGSVATILTEKLAAKLTEKGNVVRIIYTDKSFQFLDVPALNRISNKYKTYCDKDEFYSKTTYHKDDPVLHIELREWADILLIAPCSVNTMAKMVNGICDNLLTSVFRAWNFNKPVFVAPSANTKMFMHPITNEHLTKLKQWEVNIIYPTVKKLACGEYGIGALTDLDTIVNMTEGNNWELPLLNMKYLPLSPNAGSFGAKRKYDVHTGVDLYCPEFDSVRAMEDGEVYSIGQFTGKDVGCNWWNDTWQVSIKGKSGVIVYGEIDVNRHLKVGDKVSKGDILGLVLQVLKNSPKQEIEGHSYSMLHIELFDDKQCNSCPNWEIDKDRPKGILDPTPYLYLYHY